LGLLQFFLDEISQVTLPLIFFLSPWILIFNGSRALHTAGPLLVFVFAWHAIFVPCCLFLFLRWISQSAPVCSLDFGSWSEQRAPPEPVIDFPVANRFLLGTAARAPGVLVARPFPAASKGRRPDPI
jgi:hypothetical protein